jgi:hypothetical protein
MMHLLALLVVAFLVNIVSEGAGFDAFHHDGPESHRRYDAE